MIDEATELGPFGRHQTTTGHLPSNRKPIDQKINVVSTMDRFRSESASSVNIRGSSVPLTQRSYLLVVLVLGLQNIQTKKIHESQQLVQQVVVHLRGSDR